MEKQNKTNKEEENTEMNFIFVKIHKSHTRSTHDELIYRITSALASYRENVCARTK